MTSQLPQTSAAARYPISAYQAGRLTAAPAPHPETERTVSDLSSTTVLARIMTALDHATACQYMDVMDILNARGLDDEPTAGDVLAVCVVLDLPAGVLLGTVRDDLRGVKYFPSPDTDYSSDVYQL